MGKEFDEDEYGGLQEIVSFGIVRSMIKEALTQGLYDVTLDRTWETPGFQLFMGDLGNSVPYANYAPAGDRFNVSCSFDATRAESELKIARYEDKQIYVSVPENCQIVYNSKPILALKMDVNFVVELVPPFPLRSQLNSPLRPSSDQPVSSELASPVSMLTTEWRVPFLPSTPSQRS